MIDYSAEYRKRFLKRQSRFNKMFQGLFDKVADDFAQLSNDPFAKFSKSFIFPPSISKRMDGIIFNFQADMLKLTTNEITESWNLSNKKNDEIVKSYLKTLTGIKAAQKAAYLLPNIPALKAYLSQERGAETLAGTVWKVAKQARAEMEIHLGIGILNGDSAPVISRRIRQYLNNPDALFRRVRDDNGKLVASEAMKAYRKLYGLGQGVYTSAYKNAVRVARSETNMAYLTADHIRWQQMDMVIGIKISLSEMHPDYNFEEICEVLEGIYPKEYVFRGNHPQCLCHATPILSSSENFMAFLKGEQEMQAVQITKYPDAFVSFWKDNIERFMAYKSKPYILTDNRGIIDRLLNTIE